MALAVARQNPPALAGAWGLPSLECAVPQSNGFLGARPCPAGVGGAGRRCNLYDHELYILIRESLRNLRGPFERLFRLFWDRYLERTGDQGVLEPAPPFFAFRGLVVASPVWYPDISMTTRRKLFNFIEEVLNQSAFDPARVNDYLKS